MFVYFIKFIHHLVVKNTTQSSFPHYVWRKCRVLPLAAFPSMILLPISFSLGRKKKMDIKIMMIFGRGRIKVIKLILRKERHHKEHLFILFMKQWLAKQPLEQLCGVCVLERKLNRGEILWSLCHVDALLKVSGQGEHDCSTVDVSFGSNHRLEAREQILLMLFQINMWIPGFPIYFPSLCAHYSAPSHC